MDTHLFRAIDDEFVRRFFDAPPTLKFTPDGGRVDVFIESANDHVEIRVVDTGNGTSPTFLPHVFEPFRQAADATTQRHTGLGQGATFTVCLPFAASASEDQATV